MAEKLSRTDIALLLDTDKPKNCYPTEYTDCDWDSPCIICGIPTWERVQGPEHYLPIDSRCLKNLKQLAVENNYQK